MSHHRAPLRAVPDFRSPSQVLADRKLRGVWYRCRVHRLTDEPIVLGGVAYCPDERCSRMLLLVASPVMMRSESHATPEMVRHRDHGRSPRTPQLIDLVHACVCDRRRVGRRDVEQRVCRVRDVEPAAVRWALVRLVRTGRIRRVSRGVYAPVWGQI